MPSDVEAWLDQGDTPEADWGSHVLHLALADDLGMTDDELLLDLPALTQPFACRPSTCTPGRRAPRSRSCCADIRVEPSPAERRAIEGALPLAQAWLAERDVRWEGGLPQVFDAGSLTRPRGRCVFASEEPDGLRCALHRVEDAQGWARGTIKPMPCRLFPLVLVDLGDGRRLLTAVAPPTARKVGLPSARAFPCLRGEAGTTPLYQSMKDTLHELWGEPAYAAIRREVVAWRRRGHG